MKSYYVSPAMEFEMIHNEDVLTMISGGYDGFQLDDSGSEVKNVYDFSVFG